MILTVIIDPKRHQYMSTSWYDVTVSHEVLGQVKKTVTNMKFFPNTKDIDFAAWDVSHTDKETIILRSIINNTMDLFAKIGGQQ